METQPFQLDAKPNTKVSKNLKLPFNADDSEYLLNVYAYTKSETNLIPAGHEIAREQFVLKQDLFSVAQPASKLHIERKNDKIYFDSGPVSGAIDVRNGTFSNYRAGNIKLTRLPEPYFWRAPTDNDFGNHMGEELGVWKTIHNNRKVISVKIGDMGNSGLPVTVKYRLGALDADYTLEYLVRNDASIQVSATLQIHSEEVPELPRMGMRMTLPGSFKHLTYYGRGPEENYSDRKSAAFIGIWTANVDTMRMPYIRPQEFGNHTDTRWIFLKNDQDAGIMIAGLQPLNFSALKIKAEALDPGLTKKQQHPTDLPYMDDIVLHVDLAQRGLGGDNSWGMYPHDAYLLKDSVYSYSYIIQLMPGSLDAAGKEAGE